MGTAGQVLYECGICGGCHPWEFNGDCRDDANRYADEEDYAERQGISVYDIEVRSMEDRVEADRVDPPVREASVFAKRGGA